MRAMVCHHAVPRRLPAVYDVVSHMTRLLHICWKSTRRSWIRRIIAFIRSRALMDSLHNVDICLTTLGKGPAKMQSEWAFGVFLRNEYERRSGVEKRHSLIVVTGLHVSGHHGTGYGGLREAEGARRPEWLQIFGRTCPRRGFRFHYGSRVDRHATARGESGGTVYE